MLDNKPTLKLTCKRIHLIYLYCCLTIKSVSFSSSVFIIVPAHPAKINKQPLTDKAPVVSRWKRISKHHHWGVDNDLLTLPRRGSNLSPPSASVQLQGKLSPETIQLDLVPLSVIKAMIGKCDVEVSITEVVENSQQTLNNLRYTVGLYLFEIESNKIT